MNGLTTSLGFYVLFLTNLDVIIRWNAIFYGAGYLDYHWPDTPYFLPYFHLPPDYPICALPTLHYRHTSLCENN